METFIKILILSAYVCLISILFMFVWNWTVVDLFSLPKIGWGDSLGILILAQILFLRADVHTK